MPYPLMMLTEEKSASAMLFTDRVGIIVDVNYLRYNLETMYEDKAWRIQAPIQGHICSL